MQVKNESLFTLKEINKINFQTYFQTSASLYDYGTCLMITVVHLMQYTKKSKVSYIEGKSYPRLTLSARLGHTSRNTCSMKGCLEKKI